jgi:uncharacterized protein (TIGR02145 family)
LYNWFTVNTTKLAPAGWHLPTDDEWRTLQIYLMANGYNYDGTTSDNKYGKSLAANTNWATFKDTGVIGDDLTKNNSSGFSALPGGNRSSAGSFGELGSNGFWWSSTLISSNAWYRHMNYDICGVYGNTNSKTYGYSVRCVKD